MPVYDPNLDLDITSGRSWAFHLIAELPKSKHDYCPKSDASLCINKVPHLLLEVTSDPSTHSDCNRMLLQAACLARLGNALTSGQAPFIISAIYIDETLTATWYYVYQPEKTDRAVRLVLQEAVHYLRLGRLNMWRRALIFRKP